MASQKLLPEWRDPNGLLTQLSTSNTRGLLSRRAYISRVLRYSRLRVQILRELPVPDAHTKAHLAGLNRRYSIKVEAYLLNIFRLFAIPSALASAFIPLFVLVELFLLFRPEPGELLATFTAIGLLFAVWRRIIRRVENDFDWRQRVASLSLIPIALGLVVGVLLLVAGILLDSIWQNTVSQARVIKLIGTSVLQAAVLLPTTVVAFLLLASMFGYLEMRIRRRFVPDLGIIAELQFLLAKSLNSSRWARIPPQARPASSPRNCRRLYGRRAS